MKRLLITLLLGLFCATAIASDNYVDVYTLQIKRIAQAVKILEEAIVFTEDWKVAVDIDTKLNTNINRPLDFTKEDYANLEKLQKDVNDLILKHKAFLSKFESFDKEDILDPHDILGKKFFDYQAGVNR